jgi:SAM-dependent methyltransferase
MPDETLLIFHIRSARLKAREAAIREAEALLNRFSPQRQSGGPLSERKGVFWLTVGADALDAIGERLPRLGYTHAVDTLEPARNKTAETVKWLGNHYRITRLYEEDSEAARELAPDRREFALQADDGSVRRVKGYRGDGGQLSKRGLPVYDSRLLVNLVTPEQGKVESSILLEPFAGVGGIVLEAVASGYRVFSSDIDPALRFGLSQMGSGHSIASAAHLPFPDHCIDAIASEPPYDPEALSTVIQALDEMARVLKPGGKIALLCAESQIAPLREKGQMLHLERILDLPIDRKGLSCGLLVLRTTPRSGF